MPSAKIFSNNVSVVSATLRIFSLCVPGSPWIPIPISTSSSASSKLGFPAAGTVQGAIAIPMERTFAITFSATAFTSAKLPPFSAHAPAHLCTKIVPAIPLLPVVHVLFSTATSSFTTTFSTSMPSSAAISAAISKFITSPV